MGIFGHAEKRGMFSVHNFVWGGILKFVITVIFKLIGMSQVKDKLHFICL